MILALALLGCTPACEDGRICAVMGNGELGFNGDGLAALDTRLATPTDVLIDAQDRIIVVDYSNMRLRRLEPDGTVQTIVGNGIHAYSEPGALALDTPLENPIDAAYGPDSLLYVQPQHEGRVIYVNEAGTIERCAGTGELSDTGDGGPALDATMGYGGGIAVASDGTLYISDQSFSRVRRVSIDGSIDTVIGTGERGTGAAGAGPEFALDLPERVTLDEANNRLLLADTRNHRVVGMDLDTLQVQVLAGRGTEGYSGDGGPALDAELAAPVAVSVAPGGQLVIADLNNDVLRVVYTDGTIDTVAGSPGISPSKVADPLGQRVRNPAGMAWTAAGDLLVAERGGHRVLQWMGAADAL